MRTITKEMFCASLNSIQKEKERMNKSERLLSENLLDGWVVIKEGETLQTLIDLLIDLMEDDHDDSMIEWWLFDNVEKYLYDKAGNIVNDLTTAEALYDYLVDIHKS